MANLCRHLLQQRSFYPLFPVPQDLAQEVNLDMSHSDGLRMVDDELDYAPDVMILPSKLIQFFKVIPRLYYCVWETTLIHMQDRSFHVCNKPLVPQQRNIWTFKSGSSFIWYSKGTYQNRDCQVGGTTCTCTAMTNFILCISSDMTHSQVMPEQNSSFVEYYHLDLSLSELFCRLRERPSCLLQQRPTRKFRTCFVRLAKHNGFPLSR